MTTPLIGRLLVVVRPELETIAREAAGEVGDRLGELEDIGNAGLRELARMGQVLRNARRPPRT